VRFLPYAVVIVLWVYCWVEIAQSEPSDVRQLPRGLWALVVVVPLFGAAAWLAFGRPNGTQQPQPVPRAQPRTLAPDDDPEFLRSLRRPPPEEGRPPSN
jgi:Phospholipase_D-nuclease N-terminal